MLDNLLHFTFECFKKSLALKWGLWSWQIHRLTMTSLCKSCEMHWIQFLLSEFFISSWKDIWLFIQFAKKVFNSIYDIIITAILFTQLLQQFSFFQLAACGTPSRLIHSLIATIFKNLYTASIAIYYLLEYRSYFILSSIHLYPVFTFNPYNQAY